MAGRTAIGAYAPCSNSADDFRVKVTDIPDTNKLLIVFLKYARNSAFDSEAYRYGVLDSIIFPQTTRHEPSLGEHLAGGGLGSSGGKTSAYMSRATIILLPQHRYRWGASEATGKGINGRVNSTEQGRYTVDGSEIVLFSDSAPQWPKHDEQHQLPRRIRLQ